MPLPSSITACLQPGEEVLWQAQPRVHVFMLRGLTAIFYGLVWSILGAFWYHGASEAPWEGAWKIVPTLSIPFIAAGWSFFLYPINLGTRARHTWYVVTNQRIFIARLSGKKPTQLRVFKRAEMGPPHVVKRLDGLYEVILIRSVQDRPFIVPRLESGFFGITDGEAVAALVRKTIHQL